VGVTCCDASGELSAELLGVVEGDFDIIYSSGNELKSRFFQYALEGSPTFARQLFTVGRSEKRLRSFSGNKSSPRTSIRLLPRGIFLRATRMLSRLGSASSVLQRSCCDETSRLLLPER